MSIERGCTELSEDIEGIEQLDAKQHSTIILSNKCECMPFMHIQVITLSHASVMAAFMKNTGEWRLAVDIARNCLYCTKLISRANAATKVGRRQSHPPLGLLVIEDT
eukprot:1140377-Pelagomonas_calceolata.AAC.6